MCLRKSQKNYRNQNTPPKQKQKKERNETEMFQKTKVFSGNQYETLKNDTKEETRKDRYYATSLIG